jgi:hypothetical protein
MSEQVVLNKQLVQSVIELIDFYSKKGVFRVNEYKDIAEIDERLKTILAAIDANNTYNDLTAQEYGFIILIFKEGSQRIPTSIESFGQLFSIYQSFQKLLDQKVKEAEVPSVEEINSSD